MFESHVSHSFFKFDLQDFLHSINKKKLNTLIQQKLMLVLLVSAL
jgi:hypothetical protein